MDTAPAAIRGILLVLAATSAIACGGPFLVLPGGRLSGPEAPAPQPWTASDGGVLALETDPDDPYSVHVNYTVRDGAIHIDPAPGRRWLEALRADPRVRIRIDGRVYPMRAVLVSAPGPGSDRYVYRLEPRT